MSSDWERQKKEIDSYNLFLSAHWSRASYHGFSERGYELVNYFPSIPLRNSSDEAEPDFTLYDGETLILAEVKQGDNFASRHVKQMETCDDLSIERAERYVMNAGVSERFGFDGDVYQTEPIIVYNDIDEEYIDNCRNDWPDCRESLQNLESVAPVLAQEEGGRLRIVAGETGSDRLQRWLEYGIQLPKTPRVAVSLTDGLEQESIAVTLCNIWGQRAVSSPVTVEVSDVRQEFDHRELDPGSVTEAFDFLCEVDACEKTDTRVYRFTEEHLDAVLDIEQIISEYSDSSDDHLDITNF